MHHDWAIARGRRSDGTAPDLRSRVSRNGIPNLNNVGIVLEMIGRRVGAASLSICNDHLPQLADLAKRYADRQPDLADLCLIRMSELYPHHRVITADKDFRVYRRNKREVIPLICPP